MDRQPDSLTDVPCDLNGETVRLINSCLNRTNTPEATGMGDGEHEGNLPVLNTTFDQE